MERLNVSASRCITAKQKQESIFALFLVISASATQSQRCKADKLLEATNVFFQCRRSLPSQTVLSTMQCFYHTRISWQHVSVNFLSDNLWLNNSAFKVNLMIEMEWTFNMCCGYLNVFLPAVGVCEIVMLGLSCSGRVNSSMARFLCSSSWDRHKSSVLWPWEWRI